MRFQDRPRRRRAVGPAGDGQAELASQGDIGLGTVHRNDRQDAHFFQGSESFFTFRAPAAEELVIDAVEVVQASLVDLLNLRGSVRRRLGWVIGAVVSLAPRCQVRQRKRQEKKEAVPVPHAAIIRLPSRLLSDVPKTEIAKMPKAAW